MSTHGPQDGAPTQEPDGVPAPDLDAPAEPGASADPGPPLDAPPADTSAVAAEAAFEPPAAEAEFEPPAAEPEFERPPAAEPEFERPPAAEATFEPPAAEQAPDGAPQPTPAAPQGAPYGAPGVVQVSNEQALSTVTLNLWLSVVLGWISGLIFYLTERGKNELADKVHKANLNFQLLRLGAVLITIIPFIGWIVGGIASLVLLVFQILAAVSGPEEFKQGRVYKFPFNNLTILK